MNNGQHRSPRLTRRQRRHPARILSEQLSDAFTRWFVRFTDDELAAIGEVRAALHRIAGQDEAAGGVS
jgi:hypothetical protein